VADRHSEITLNLSGLLCPLPVLKARKRLGSMAPGEILRVIATDPMSAIDMPHFCNEQGHELVESSTEAGALIFRIRRK
jgi:tRNA 2-thiouridine synthesizing protein A